ncbi:adenine deaminase [Jiulongibacter sediminis]|uniref:Adenine deaminase n=1 Tax=Jiulongibacter sediminis TaxID=1605367 RepID=A0A0P7BTL1_9BACT|nr:adenine deaminase [Jiulongibacter sediminis]KPM47926.1 adenine deaminase [Jiulongibacter sediminis]TBX24109.1 adenine deaminase [Jiulongibacter sediminis]
MEVLQGNIVNIFEDSIFWGELILNEGRIFTIKNLGDEKAEEPYFLPGFVDAHVHIESSMLTPASFGRIALCHGTVGSVSDPHEIANVLGITGVNYMIDNASQTPFKVTFGAPSCVPATTFETAGAVIDSEGIEKLLRNPKIGYLAEMMNYPGVIYEDEEVIKKLEIARRMGKPIDGHAPGLRGEGAEKYFSNGITTDHECFTEAEALEKLKLGVKILIREGSAAKNFEALIPLAKEWSHQMMFCSDDKHPDELLKGHINALVSKAIKAGIPLFEALRIASMNPVKHYGLDIGLLQEGDPADFIQVTDLKNFKVTATWINGEKVAEFGKSLLPEPKNSILNNFKAGDVMATDLKIISENPDTKINVIKVNEGQLVTDSFQVIPLSEGREIIADTEQDILKLVVHNRYSEAKPAVAFIHGFGLKTGAIASSVAHDSHNVIAVGTDDNSIADAINLVVREKGGIAAVAAEEMGVIPLPVAGLMSDKNAETIASDYEQIDKFTKTELGSVLAAPFMSLSFMALLVIPQLKLSDLGLFDGGKFEFKSLLEIQKN